MLSTNEMKVAIPINKDRVAPRLPLAKEVIIVELRGKREMGRNKVDISLLHPMEIPDFLASQGVTRVIAAGVDWHMQEMLRMRNIDLIWGIMGAVDEVLAFYLKKGLQDGMGPCPPPPRRGRRFRGLHV
jgi:predicted Fe-Mo cluster-binding NifX family protein